MPIDLEDRGQALENEYFHRKEKELIEKMKAKLAAEETTTSGIKCPKCDGTLHETDFESVKIDVCDTCSGVWLDAGELAQIVDKDKDSGWFGGLFK
ncbi:MAG TPA: zf-TFIIB domain-containing protein [Pyrinomonadaceae bacterium]|nr:zf-TFIIB domain-containing protein [Pyrinomonadaceae bacterium]